MNIPEGFGTVTPYLFVDEPSKYIAFLSAALGGKEIGRSLTPDGAIANAQIRFGSTTIMVSEASAGFPATRAAHYLYVADADASMKTAIANGAKLIMEASDMPYGDRQGGVLDPSDNIWWISQRLTKLPYF